MKKILILHIFTVFTIIIATAQTVGAGYVFWNTDMQAIAKPESKEGHIYFKDNLATPSQQLLSVQKTAFGLTNNDQAELIDTWTYHIKTAASTTNIFKSIKVYQ